MREDEDKKDAIEIVSKGENHLNAINETRAWKLGNLWFFDKTEFDEASAIKDLVRGYLDSSADSKRPLSIAVFGPPGSGKSFAVREIQSEMNKIFAEKLHLSYDEVNLTQIATPSDLFLAVKEIHRSNQVANKVSRRDAIPFVFFDEFDAPCGGVPLGWLNWFLAPMQDSAIGHGEGKIELKKAVYFFAGGTAPTLSEFSAVHSREFVTSKGPDFVSRLRGYLNIRGPNDECRTCSRRALVVRTSLGGMTEKPKPYPSRDLLDRIFNEGRFKHGSRSISVLLDMASARARERHLANNGSKQIIWDDLPPPHILSIHADQGPLDPETIGGLVGISVGKDAQEDASTDPAEISKILIGRLWQLGATISYGGRWNREFTQSLISESRRLRRPTAVGEKRVEVFSRDVQQQAELGDEIEVVPVPAHWSGSVNEDENVFLSRCVSAFRMRWTMSCRSVARVLISGNIVTFSGRMPGVLEEGMLALSLTQPIYVVGGFSGAATLVGELLGLSTTKAPVFANPQIAESWKYDEEKYKYIAAHAKLFQPAMEMSLPLTALEALDFISKHAIGGPFWPQNGLSIRENRELFASKDMDEIVNLICRGLLRRFGY